MLSDWERQALRGIEEGLRADGGLAAPSAHRRGTAVSLLRLLGRLGLVAGSLAVLSGLVVVSGASAASTALVAVVGGSCWCWWARRTARRRLPP